MCTIVLIYLPNILLFLKIERQKISFLSTLLYFSYLFIYVVLFCTPILCASIMYFCAWRHNFPHLRKRNMSGQMNIMKKCILHMNEFLYFFFEKLNDIGITNDNEENMHFSSYIFIIYILFTYETIQSFYLNSIA